MQVILLKHCRLRRQRIDQPAPLYKQSRHQILSGGKGSLNNWVSTVLAKYVTRFCIAIIPPQVFSRRSFAAFQLGREGFVSERALGA